MRGSPGEGDKRANETAGGRERKGKQRGIVSAKPGEDSIYAEGVGQKPSMLQSGENGI